MMRKMRMRIVRGVSMGVLDWGMTKGKREVDGKGWR